MRNVCKNRFEAKAEKVVQIGPDLVTVTDEEVLIQARHPMPDWEVREFTVIPVYFEDKKIRSRKKRGKPTLPLLFVICSNPGRKGQAFERKPVPHLRCGGGG